MSKPYSMEPSKRPPVTYVRSAKTRNSVGLQFGRLKIIGQPFRVGARIPMVVCECDCGVIVCLPIISLRSGHTKSCGCLQREFLVASKTTHGYSKHPAYVTWRSMVGRCYAPATNDYDKYGGRGISVCDEWKRSPGVFCEWAELNGFAVGLQIDRINNDGNYEPSNCRFVTPAVNIRNRSITKVVTAFGETKTAIEWAEDGRCLYSYNTLISRLRRLRAEDAIAKPCRKRPTKAISA